MQFLTPDILPDLRRFPPDMAPLPVERNTILAHPLVRYYEEGWSRWFR